MVKIYLAGPFFNKEQIERVIRVENALHNNDTVSQIFSPRLEEHDVVTKNNIDKESTEGLKLVFNNDIKAIDNADVVVAIHDFDDKYTDSGTAFEIGYAYKSGTPIVLYQEKDPIYQAPMNLMLSQSLHAYITNAKDLQAYDFNILSKIDFTIRY